MIIQPMTASLDHPAPPTTAAGLDGKTALPQLGVIRALGDDAASFLQSQLTQDMVQMRPGDTRLAALCNPKGRMLASFIACRRAPDEFWLVCSRDLLPATLRKLSMFVLRAKVRLSDASDELALYGLIGDAARAASTGEALASDAFVAPLPPADGAARALLITAAGSPAPAGQALPPGWWDWAAVRGGVATVTKAVAEAFVPQMLNYESVGGVNFKKGCYPGQEVVARSQFRGAIKRRAYVAQVDGVAQAGDDVFAAADPEQPVGQIAQAATTPQGGTAVIAVLQVVQASADLRVGGVEGPPMTDIRIPYALAEDI